VVVLIADNSPDQMARVTTLGGNPYLFAVALTLSLLWVSNIYISAFLRWFGLGPKFGEFVSFRQYEPLYIFEPF
jgi:hypothetical protein